MNIWGNNYEKIFFYIGLSHGEGGAESTGFRSLNGGATKSLHSNSALLRLTFFFA